MAFKLDFSKLGAETPEERAQQEAAREAQLAAADEKKRAELSKKSVIVALESEIETRSTRTGQSIASIRGVDEKGHPVRGVYFAPEHMSREDRSALLDTPREGDRLKLDGYWKPREWTDRSGEKQKAWEFQVQRFAPAEGRPSERPVEAKVANNDELAAPKLKSSMYFSYGRDAREGIQSRTTFDAIVAGERTSTTRYPAWPGYDRWRDVDSGDVVRFYADKEMKGRHVDVIVESVKPIDLKNCSAADLTAWSKAEGWSEAKGRDSGRRYGEGLQIRYRVPEQEVQRLRELSREPKGPLAQSAGLRGQTSGRVEAIGPNDGFARKQGRGFNRGSER